MNDRAAYVALALTPGIGSARLQNLLASCGSATGALTAPAAFLGTVPGISAAAVTAIKQRRITDGEQVLAAAEKAGITVLTPADAEFPAQLREIPEPPELIFAAGRMELLARPAVAVVGSRDHTAYGAQVCTMIGGGAARAGLTVVSGMARGLDAVAHSSALDAGGGSIGVLGNGIGVIYPAANRQLYERMSTDGLLLTEFAPGERPHAGGFPKRNRLISALARVTVVVEAAPGSGALITAGTALDQGRDVMAVPGPITSRTSGGTNALIRDGAHPLLELNDLFQFYTEAMTEAVPARVIERHLPPDLDPQERSLAELLSSGERQLDVLAHSARRSVADVLSL
ncbi:MAG TPA: DNA-processing protein DprA, partial [Gemmatimonadales bacterium]|nr:DNA-processing protein DprA [Gemmatimonadales bacterium]